MPARRAAAPSSRTAIAEGHDYLNEKAKVIVVEVNDEAAAYTIFEVLNDRGLELSVSEP